MTEYRTGNHWGVTIVREGTQPYDASGHRPDAELVAVVTNGDRDLAERICALLNADDGAADVIGNLAAVRAAAEGLIADSCTCTVSAGPDTDCVVHQGRRARGPKPPPVGPGCICDGSGRTCPRHGAVL